MKERNLSCELYVWPISYSGYDIAMSNIISKSIIAAAYVSFCILLITDGCCMTFVILHNVHTYASMMSKKDITYTTDCRWKNYSLLEVFGLCNYILIYAQTPTVHTFENILSYRIIQILIFLKSVPLPLNAVRWTFLFSWINHVTLFAVANGLTVRSYASRGPFTYMDYL